MSISTTQRIRETEYGLWLLDYVKRMRGKAHGPQTVRDIWMAGYAAGQDPRTLEELDEAKRRTMHAEQLDYI